MSRDNSGLFVISGSISRQFQNFSGEIFENSSQVDWCTSSDTFSVVSFAEKTMDTSNWELETGSG